MAYIPELGDGLGFTGKYTPNASSTYLKTASSLYDADNKLDAAIASIVGGTATTDVIATNTSAVGITKNTYQKLTYTATTKDTQSEFSTSTSTYTSKYNQTVLVAAFSYITGVTNTVATLSLIIYKNGTAIYSATDETYCTNNYGSNICTCNLSYPVDVVIGDTINIYAYQTETTTKNTGGKEVLIIKRM